MTRTHTRWGRFAALLALLACVFGAPFSAYADSSGDGSYSISGAFSDSSISWVIAIDIDKMVGVQGLDLAYPTSLTFTAKATTPQSFTDAWTLTDQTTGAVLTTSDGSADPWSVRVDVTSGPAPAETAEPSPGGTPTASPEPTAAYDVIEHVATATIAGPFEAGHVYALSYRTALSGQSPPHGVYVMTVGLASATSAVPQPSPPPSPSASPSPSPTPSPSPSASPSSSPSSPAASPTPSATQSATEAPTTTPASAPTSDRSAAAAPGNEPPTPQQTLRHATSVRAVVLASAVVPMTQPLSSPSQIRDAADSTAADTRSDSSSDASPAQTPASDATEPSPEATSEAESQRPVGSALDDPYVGEPLALPHMANPSLGGIGTGQGAALTITFIAVGALMTARAKWLSEDQGL